MSSVLKAREALRVSQLDIDELDSSVTDTVISALISCFQYPFGNFDMRTSSLLPHLKTFTYAALLHYLLIHKPGGQTIGQKLLRLRYGEEQTLKQLPQSKLRILHACMVVMYWNKSIQTSNTAALPAWISSRLPHSETLRKCWLFIEKVLNTANLINFLLFLYQGKYQNLHLRLLGIRTVHTDQYPPQRSIDSSYVRRELIWQACTQVIIFILSLINIRKLRRYFSKWFCSVELSEEDKSRVDIRFCAFCDKTPRLPYQGSCQLHVYCYCCVRAQIENDQNVVCPKCQRPINGELKPLSHQTFEIVNDDDNEH